MKNNFFVVEKNTGIVKGIKCSLDDIGNSFIKDRLKPFVIKYGCYIYMDNIGNFGAATPKRHILREIVKSKNNLRE